MLGVLGGFPWVLPKHQGREDQGFHPLSLKDQYRCWASKTQERKSSLNIKFLGGLFLGQKLYATGLFLLFQTGSGWDVPGFGSERPGFGKTLFLRRGRGIRTGPHSLLEPGIFLGPLEPRLEVRYRIRALRGFVPISGTHSLLWNLCKNFGLVFRSLIRAENVP